MNISYKALLKELLKGGFRIDSNSYYLVIACKDNEIHYEMLQDLISGYNIPLDEDFSDGEYEHGWYYFMTEIKTNDLVEELAND